MNKATILIISENSNRLETLVETFHKQFYTLAASSEEEAINRFLQSPVNAVLFGEDTSEIVKNRLTKLFAAQQADTIFANNDPSANMIDRIKDAISNKQKENKPAFSFTDDVLKNAGLNIEIQ